MRTGSTLLTLAGWALVAMAALRPAAAEAAGDKALGQYLAAECVTCHQLSGQYEGIPPIIGWPDETFIEIIGEYRTKKRADPIMQTIAGRLSQEEVAALAAYFGSLSPEPAVKPQPQKDSKRRKR
jgi:cytochrome c553